MKVFLGGNLCKDEVENKVVAEEGKYLVEVRIEQEFDRNQLAFVKKAISRPRIGCLKWWIKSAIKTSIG